MSTRKKVLALTLILTLTLASASAFAAGIQAGTPAFAVNTAYPTIVGFGGRQWSVIGYNGYGVASTTGTLTLLAIERTNTSQFSNKPMDDPDDYDDDGNHYSNSDLAYNMRLAYEDIPSKEQGLVSGRTLTGGNSNRGQPGYNDNNIAGADVTDAKFWPLSVNEFNSINTSLRPSLDRMWLRSPGSNNESAMLVWSPAIISFMVIYPSGDVRPAFYLNLSSVIFTSDAVDGKSSAAVGSGLVGVSVPTGPENLLCRIPPLL